MNLYRYTGNNPVNYRDPLGLYDEVEVHLIKTYQWALDVGIDPDTAWKIGWANMSMDKNATQPDWIWGWLTFGGKLHFQTTKYAQVGLDQCLRRKDVKGFGNFLHVLQDSFSHKGVNPIEHIFLGHSPDQYSEMSPRDQKMKELTVWWLQEFKRVNQPVFKRR